MVANTDAHFISACFVSICVLTRSKSGHCVKHRRHRPKQPCTNVDCLLCSYIFPSQNSVCADDGTFWKPRLTKKIKTSGKCRCVEFRGLMFWVPYVWYLSVFNIKYEISDCFHLLDPVFKSVLFCISYSDFMQDRNNVSFGVFQTTDELWCTVFDPLPRTIVHILGRIDVYYRIHLS